MWGASLVLKRMPTQALSNKTEDIFPGHVIRSLSLLWLGGLAMRVAILAVPPVIPQIHNDLHMSETEVGVLMGLPLMVFAIAAVPGSLLVARLGAALTVIVGLVVAGLAAAARGAAADVAMLYGATILMGLGTAVVQPAMPALVREWLPTRPNLGSAASTNGMVVGTTLGPALSVPFVLPLVGQSWRLDLVVWAIPLFAAALTILLLRPQSAEAPKRADAGARWWPDWSNPLIWLLGIAFGCNNSIYFTANAFLPDYLTHLGRSDLVGPALTCLNGAQLVASFLLMPTADWVLGRTWPYLVFGPLAFLAVLGIVLLDGFWVVVCAGAVGFAIAIVFVMMLAAPPVLSPPGQVHRVAAGMFTISYTLGVIIPALSGGLWDMTGVPWSAFVPLGLCAVTMTVFGVALGRRRAR
jgi:CP family cyanate transporter-like MFS transporter